MCSNSENHAQPNYIVSSIFYRRTTWFVFFRFLAKLLRMRTQVGISCCVSVVISLSFSPGQNEAWSKGTVIGKI